MKLANNFLSATALAATSEAVAFGVAHGLDMTTMIEVINVSTGRNSATVDKFPNRILTGTYDAGFSTAHMTKDVGLFVDRSGEVGTANRVSGAVANAHGTIVMRPCPGATSPRSGSSSSKSSSLVEERRTCGQMTAATSSFSVPSALCGAMNAWPVPGCTVSVDVLAHRLQLGLERLGGLRPEEVVVLGHVPADLCRQRRPVGLHVALREAVERHGRDHLVGSRRGDEERQHPTHAEADDADARCR